MEWWYVCLSVSFLYIQNELLYKIYSMDGQNKLEGRHVNIISIKGVSTPTVYKDNSTEHIQLVCNKILIIALSICGRLYIHNLV